MKCDKCNKEAIIRLVVSSSENSQSINLCHKCYLKILRGEIPPNLLTGEFELFNGVLTNLLDWFRSGDHMSIIDDDGTTCSLCGNSFTDIISKGRFGCGKCYVTFYDKVKHILDLVQGSNEYPGMVPEKFGEIRELITEIGIRTVKLVDAVHEEEYETAAVLRDELAALNNRLGLIFSEVSE